MRALLVEPEQPPREVYMENSIAAIAVRIDASRVDRWEHYAELVSYLYDSTAHTRGKRLNRAVFGADGAMLTIISGPFLIVGRGIMERLCSLSPEQADMFTKEFFMPHVFVRENNRIVPWMGGGKVAG